MSKCLNVSTFFSVSVFKWLNDSHLYPDSCLRSWVQSLLGRPACIHHGQIWFIYRFIYLQIYRFIHIYLQPLNGTGGPIQSLSGLLVLTMSRFMALLKAPDGPGGPTKTIKKLAFTQLQALNGPGGPIQCLSGLLAFTLARFITLHQTLKEPAGPIGDIL